MGTAGHSPVRLLPSATVLQTVGWACRNAHGPLRRGGCQGAPTLRNTGGSAPLLFPSTSPKTRALALELLECWDGVKHSKETAELSLQLVYVLQSLGC